MTVNDEMVERAIAVAHQCGFVPDRSLVRAMLEAAALPSRDAVLEEAALLAIKAADFGFHSSMIAFSIRALKSKPAQPQPVLTEAERAHVEGQRKRCSSDTQGLLAIIDRLTTCAVPDEYKLVNTNSVEANNVAALRASDVRTTDVDASPSNVPAETYPPDKDGWQPIETAPTSDDDFFLVCNADPADDRSPFVIRGSILASARKLGTPSHLSMHHLTHWRPLPAPPAQEDR